MTSKRGTNDNINDLPITKPTEQQTYFNAASVYHLVTNLSAHGYKKGNSS